VVLFAGQGGVGRTTAAAATAVLAARSAKVLLVSGGALGVPPGPDPVPVGELQVLHVDVRRGFEARWPGSAAELALPPGAAALLTLLEARDRALAGNWDAVLLDGPPLDTLLSLGSLAGTVERLWPQHARVVHRSAFTDVVSSFQGALGAAGDLLAVASVRLVVDPSPAGVEAGRGALTALALHGHAVDTVIANRLLPAEAGGRPGPGRCARRRRTRWPRWRSRCRYGARRTWRRPRSARRRCSRSARPCTGRTTRWRPDRSRWSRR
jgi:arsenite-transporting ATPase